MRTDLIPGAVLLLSAWLPGLASADPLDNLPAELASVSEWDARLASLEALRDGTPDDDLPRLKTAIAVITALKEREPSAPRARVRSLAAGAVDRRARVRAEAQKAAAIGAELPEIPVREDWFARLPHPSPAGLDAVRLRVPDLGSTEGWASAAEDVHTYLTSHLKAAGWPAAPQASVEIAGTLGEVYTARWSDRVGTAADVSWVVTRGGESVYEVVTRGFQAGPSRGDTPETLVAIALDGLLARGEMVAALAPPSEGAAGAEGAEEVAEEVVEEGEEPPIARTPTVRLCAFRTKHADDRALPFEIDGVQIVMGAATYGCVDLPEGSVAKSMSGHGSVTVGEGGALIRLDHADAPGRASVALGDRALFDRLKGKSKLTEVELISMD